MIPQQKSPPRRETLEPEEARGMDTIGLPPAARTAESDPYEVALDTSGSGSGGPSMPSVVYGRQLSPKLFVPITPDLGEALRDSRDRAARFKPGSWGVLGAEVEGGTR